MVDDDGDGTIDEKDEFVAGPIDPTIPGDIGSVVGDDVDLDRDGDLISHLAANDPDPNPNVYFATLDESQADARETNAQDGLRTSDWASPGKQHGPDLAAPNANGEINSYAD